MSTKKTAAKKTAAKKVAKPAAPEASPPAKKAAKKAAAKPAESEAQTAASVLAEAKAQAAKEAQEAKAQEQEAKRGEKLELARMKGVEIAGAYTDSAIGQIQHVVGKKFVADATGLSIKEGEIPSESDMAAAISGIATVSTRLDSVRNSVIWSLGDLVTIARQFNRGDELIEQVIAVTGKAKHTVQQAERLASWCPHDKRIAELSATHHMEAFNYSRPQKDTGKPLIPDKKLFTMLAAAAKGEKVVELDKATGERVEVWNPISCADFRKQLQDEAGIKPKEKTPEPEPLQTTEDKEVTEGQPSEAAATTTNGYLYFSPDYVPFWSVELDIRRIAAGYTCVYTCVCLTAMQVINEDGEEAGPVSNLTDAPKLPKPKKEKTVESAPSTEEGFGDLPE